MSTEKYEPTWEEVKKAEDMMAEKDKYGDRIESREEKLSGARERGLKYGSVRLGLSEDHRFSRTIILEEDGTPVLYEEGAGLFDSRKNDKKIRLSPDELKVELDRALDMLSKEIEQENQNLASVKEKHEKLVGKMRARGGMDEDIQEEEKALALAEKEHELRVATLGVKKDIAKFIKQKLNKS